MNFKTKTIDSKKILILLCALLLPLNLTAGKLFVKMTFGVVSGGDVDDTLLVEKYYSDYMSMGQKKESEYGLDLYFEIIYQINPYIGFSLGNGYTSKMLKGNDSQFIHPLSPHGDFIFSPEFSSEVIPVCFSAIFSLPVGSSFQMNFTGGVGYYFATFESKTKWNAPDLPGFSTWEFLSDNYEGKARTAGYHLGAGFDIDLSWNMFLTVDALYRKVNFNNIKGSGDKGGNSTLFYLYFFKGGDFPEYFDYRVSQIDFSGFSVRAGFKFRF